MIRYHHADVTVELYLHLHTESVPSVSSSS